MYNGALPGSAKASTACNTRASDERTRRPPLTSKTCGERANPQRLKRQPLPGWRFRLKRYLVLVGSVHGGTIYPALRLAMPPLFLATGGQVAGQYYWLHRMVGGEAGELETLRQTPSAGFMCNEVLLQSLGRRLLPILVLVVGLGVKQDTLTKPLSRCAPAAITNGD